MRGFNGIFAVWVALALGACGGGGEGQKVVGTVAGTEGGTVQLLLFGDGMLQETAVSGDGSFAFPQAISGEYFVLVDSDPLGIACTTFNSDGEETPRNASAVVCARTAFNVGGTITSDPDIGDVLVELRNTVNGESITLANSGDFTFAQPVTADGNYNVVVANQTAGIACSVANGSGAASYEVANIAVTCTPELVALAPMSSTADVGVPTTGLPPSGLKAVFDGGQFIFVTWDADPRSTHRLFVDGDGLGPAATVFLATGNRDYVLLVDPAQVLLTYANARYSVQSCFNGVCSRVSDQVRIDLTRLPNYVAELDRAIDVTQKLFFILQRKYDENMEILENLILSSGLRQLFLDKSLSLRKAKQREFTRLKGLNELRFQSLPQ